jgi:hypothetical protein
LVNGIQYLGMALAPECHCNELPVLRVKAAKRGIGWELNVVIPGASPRMNLNPLAQVSIRLVLPNPLEESISKPGLAGQRQIPHVLIQYSAPIVENDSPLAYELLQCVDARKDTGRPRLRRLAVGHDGNIGVDDKGVQD